MKSTIASARSRRDRSRAHASAAGKTRTRLVVLMLLLAAPFVLSAASCRSVVVGLEEGRLRPCPSSPNCVCSEDPDTEAVIPPLAFRGDPRTAFDSLIRFLREEPRVEIVTIEPEYVHAVFKTRILRFRDDVEFRLDADGQRIHVRSASRVGYSDMGANRARVESIRERWQPAG